jgi:hypothetical protein
MGWRWRVRGGKRDLGPLLWLLNVFLLCMSNRLVCFVFVCVCVCGFLKPCDTPTVYGLGYNITAASRNRRINSFHYFRCLSVDTRLLLWMREGKKGGGEIPWNQDYPSQGVHQALLLHISVALCNWYTSTHSFNRQFPILWLVLNRNTKLRVKEKETR